MYKRGNTELLGEVVAHVALSGGKQAAALHKVNDDAVRLPFLHVTMDLLIPLKIISVGHVVGQHVHGHGLKRPLRIMPEAELPQPAHGRIRGRHRARLPLGKHVAEGAKMRIRRRSFKDQPKLLLIVDALLQVALLLKLGQGGLKELEAFALGRDARRAAP